MSTSAEPIRIGVVGTGWFATQVHIPALLGNPRAQLVALADADPERLARAGAHFGIGTRFTSVGELLDRIDVDGVIVATPSAQHHEVAREALDAGVGVLVEKPMTLFGAEAWDLVEAGRAENVPVMVGYTYHFTPAARRFREIVSGGAIGDLVLTSGLFASMVEAFYRGEPDQFANAHTFTVHGPKSSTYSATGGGQAHTQVTHAMGLLLYATDRDVVEVSARMVNLGLDVDVADAMSFVWDNGAVGTMASTGNLRPSEPHHETLHVYGTQGYAV